MPVDGFCGACGARAADSSSSAVKTASAGKGRRPATSSFLITVLAFAVGAAVYTGIRVGGPAANATQLSYTLNMRFTDLAGPTAVRLAIEDETGTRTVVSENISPGSQRTFVAKGGPTARFHLFYNGERVKSYHPRSEQWAAPQ